MGRASGRHRGGVGINSTGERVAVASQRVFWAGRMFGGATLNIGVVMYR
jgi:hypothetical protein